MTSPNKEDELFMHRCLQLAENGIFGARPNPMVGAVIVADGRIIGEGYHVCCGEAHAEVNAFAAVSPADEGLLPRATLYVSLEPCCHYGKTPPCADLIIRKGVRRVVVGCQDDFAEVQGRGIDRLRRVGIDVTVGVLEAECRWLNRRFFTFHRLRRPHITLKWAQTANGFIDNEGKALQLSTPFTQMLCHKLRSECDAILVGRVTDEREHPRLDVRHWACLPENKLTAGMAMLRQPRKIIAGGGKDLSLKQLYEEGIQSLLVEGGARTHEWFLSQGLWDELRIETAPVSVAHGTKAAQVPSTAHLISTEWYDGNIIRTFTNKP